MLLLIFVSVCTHAAFVAADELSVRQILSDPAAIVTADWGQVAPADEPESAPEAPAVLLIQDIHAHPDAQRHIAQMLEHWTADFGLRTILVEGGEGPQSLARLRIASPAIRRSVADQALQEGWLAGDEYFEIVSDAPLDVQGVDSAALYEQNYQAYARLEQVRAAAGPVIEQVRRQVEQLRPLVYGDAFQTWLRNRGDFETQRLALAKYVSYLLQQAQAVGLDTSAFPHLSQVEKLEAARASLNLEQAADEQRAAIRKAAPRLTEAHRANLQQLAQDFKAQAITSEAYVERLAAILMEAGVDLQTYPTLAAYRELFALQAGVQPKPVWDEMVRLRSAVEAQWPFTADEAALWRVDRSAAQAEGLLSLSWTPLDFEAFRASGGWPLAEWKPTLQHLSTQHGLAFDPQWDESALQSELASAEGFYAVAELRNEAMAQRALAFVETAREPVVALIVGGFHAERITQLLSEKGIRVAVVTPRIDTASEPGRYESLLKFKHALRQRTEGPNSEIRQASSTGTEASVL